MITLACDIVLNGQNFVTEDNHTASPNDYAYTGAYSPFGVPNRPYEVQKGIVKATGRLQPQFLIANHPMIPQKPFATFAPYSALTGFDFNYNRNFGPYRDA